MIFLDGDDDDEDGTMIQTDRTSFLLRFPPPLHLLPFDVLFHADYLQKGIDHTGDVCQLYGEMACVVFFFSVSEINYAQLKQFNAIQFKAISLCKYYVCTCTHTGGGYGTTHQSVIDYVGGKTQME